MKNQLKKPNRKTLYPKAFLIKTLTILPILAMLTMIAGCSKQAQTEVYQVKTITTNSELYAFLNLELLAMPVYTQEEPEKVEEIHPMANPICGSAGKHSVGHPAHEYYLNRKILAISGKQDTTSIQAT